jgi:hypothetical protein
MQQLIIADFRDFCSRYQCLPEIAEHRGPA